jgi:threonylcarbamoyladenosine tRNA methylthiotransferase MtaB
MVEDGNLDLSRLAGARFIIKNKDKYRIPEIINSQHRRSNKRQKARFGITSFKGHTRVFVKIQDGCDNICSYCKVRLVRGRSRSRPFKDVMDECATLVRNGSKEIVLTGICLGDYGKDLKHGTDLCRLIKEICRIEGDWRLRLSSIEPKDITEGLIQELSSQERLCKHLHIPFQSGDDYILKRMKRPYTSRAYLDIVKRLKETIADIAISTDIMVGFPGETEKRFRNTLDFVKTINPMRVHVFPFSKRKGTEAYIYGDGISSIVKKERRDRLLYLARGLSREFVERFADKKVRVLVEDKRSREGYLQGYTDRYIKVFLDGPDHLKGELLNFRI